MKRLLYIILFIVALTGCAKDKIFDHPFVYIIQGSSYENTTKINSQSNNLTVQYDIHLSSKTLDDALIVSYDITAGDGLEEGVDYEIVTKGRQATFVPGVFTIPVRIKYLRHTVDPTKDNSITITLTGSSMGFDLGFPGPDHNNIYHKIIKIN